MAITDRTAAPALEPASPAGLGTDPAALGHRNARLQGPIAAGRYPSAAQEDR